MASNRKIESCKANGAKAKGSKSPEGIAHSSMNAVTHGLTANTLLLPGESQDRFDEFADSVRGSINPHTPVQQILVHNLVEAAWRQRRLLSYETTSISLAVERMRDEVDKEWTDPTPQVRDTLAFQQLCKDGYLATFTRYDSHLNRQFHNALKALENTPNDPNSAILRNDANPENEQPPHYQPPADLPEFLAQTTVAACSNSEPSGLTNLLRWPLTVLLLLTCLLTTTGIRKTIDADCTTCNSTRVIPFRLIFQPGISVYEQVVYAAKKAIVSGQLRAGDAFPSVRALSKALKINPNTAHKVVTQLVTERVLEVLPGVGTVVAGPSSNGPERANLLRNELEQLVVEAKRLGLNLDEVTDAVASHWTRLDGKKPSTARKV